MTVNITPQDNTLGFTILFGSSPEKLYHSAMVFAAGEHRVGALIKGREYLSGWTPSTKTASPRASA